MEKTDPKFIQPCRLASLNLHGRFFTFVQFCKSDVHISLDQKTIPAAPGFGLLTYRELGYSQVPTTCLTHTDIQKTPLRYQRIFLIFTSMATEELKVTLGKLGLGPGKSHFILAGLCVSFR